ncbi:MAG: TolC family protein [Pirellulaceae bacterium]
MRFIAMATALTLVLGCRTSRHQEAPHSRLPNITVGTAAYLSAPAIAETASNRSIEDLVFLGLSNSPQLAEARHRIRSLEHRIPQQTALPDPVLNSTSHLLPVETAAGQQVFGLGVSQKYIRNENRQTRAAIAQDEVHSARAELAKLEREIAEKIRVASIQLLEVRAIIKVTQSDFDALRQIEEVALRRYELAANVSQQQILNIQIEQSNIENQLAGLQQREKSYQARIARLVHLPVGTNFIFSDELEDVLQTSKVEQLIAQALAARPELQAQLARIRRDRRKILLAQLQNKPDFTVGLNWIATSDSGLSPVANGDDALMLGVGFNLPIYKDRICAAVGEATSTSLASSFALESLRDQIAEEVFDSIAQLESSRDMLSLLQEDIVPKSARALELSIEAYSNGNEEYSQVLSNWRSLLKYRLTEVRLISTRMQQLATLTRQVGQLELLQSPADFNEQDKVLSVAKDLSLARDPVVTAAPASAADLERRDATTQSSP